MYDLTLKDVTAVCGSVQLAQGFRHHRAGDVLTAWVGDQTLGAQIRHPVRQHTARVRVDAEGNVTPQCTCVAQARQRFCQHVAALLVAWVFSPSDFTRYKGPDTAPLVADASPREAHDPLATFQVALDRVEVLLLDLLAHGLVTLNAGRVQLISEVREQASAYGLGGIAVALDQLAVEVGNLNAAGKPGGVASRQFDEARYVSALNTAWHLTRGARQALEAGDVARLREVADVDLSAEQASVQEAVELVEVGYRGARPGGDGTRFLLSLDDGEILAERARKGGPFATVDSAGLPSVLRGSVAVYPASDVAEVVMLDVENLGPPSPQVWERASSWAETTFGGPVDRYRETVAALPGSEQVHAWFAPSAVVLRAGGVSFVDADGRQVEAGPESALERSLLDAPLSCVFGSLAKGRAGLRFEALSLLAGGDAGPLALHSLTS